MRGICQIMLNCVRDRQETMLQLPSMLPGLTKINMFLLFLLHGLASLRTRTLAASDVSEITRHRELPSRFDNPWNRGREYIWQHFDESCQKKCEFGTLLEESCECVCRSGWRGDECDGKILSVTTPPINPTPTPSPQPNLNPAQTLTTA